MHMVARNWTRVPHWITLEIICDSHNVDHLLSIVVQTLKEEAGLGAGDVASCSKSMLHS
jgi:hypothetical protein